VFKKKNNDLKKFKSSSNLETIETKKKKQKRMEIIFQKNGFYIKSGLDHVSFSG